jgi:hypothetical protein
MWEPQHLTTLWASTACYRDTFTFFLKVGLCDLHPVCVVYPVAEQLSLQTAKQNVIKIRKVFFEKET